MTDDTSAYGIEDEQADTGRGDTSDPAEHHVVVGDVEVDDEPEELREEDVADDPEDEPLEPDEPA